MHRIRIELRLDAAIVNAEGEIDAYAAPELSSSLESVDATRVVVDLERVSFLDSTALGVVVRTVRELTKRGAGVRVVLPRGTARRIFEITTLDRVLPIVRTRAEALRELADDVGVGTD